MDKRRYSPPSFRKKSTAVLWFLVGVALLFAAGLFLRHILSLDYASYIAEDYPQKNTLAEGGYVAITPPPVAVVTPSPQMRDYAQATPSPTKVPYEKYSTKAQRVVMPDMMFDTVEAEITRFETSQADDNQVLFIEGWGFLKGYDAELSRVYIALSSFHASDYRFYNVARRTDFGTEFGSGSGENLQYAGFESIIRIDLLPDGMYNLGVFVVNQINKKETAEGYLSLASSTRFTVKNGAVESIG
ncbi:MAG: hypothetical protein ACOYI8_09790 [Christensenellales bacterium]|jgi:hypothetical protein